jgi:hypothetical protein
MIIDNIWFSECIPVHAEKGLHLQVKEDYVVHKYIESLLTDTDTFTFINNYKKSTDLNMKISNKSDNEKGRSEAMIE